MTNQLELRDFFKDMLRAPSELEMPKFINTCEATELLEVKYGIHTSHYCVSRALRSLGLIPAIQQVGGRMYQGYYYMPKK